MAVLIHDSRVNTITHEFGPYNLIRSYSLLNPINYCRQNIMVPVKRDAICRRSSTLPDSPSTRTTSTMVHARDPEQTIERIHLFQVIVHFVRQPLPEAN
ncbi:hypothetical protein ANO14919_063260 [Xylariales sp. No.14919]|nr:hypothetical protein ANO14919_063260 [Xylariales sp. No.14919]